MARGDFGKIIRYIVILVAFVLLAIVPTTNVAYAAELSDASVVVMSAQMSEGEVTVDAVLRQNTGIMGMTLEIEYDATAMTLTNVERGEALSTLEYITTGVDTPYGYAIRPFKLNWSGDENDLSTGKIVRMYFKMNDSVADGEYVITLKTDTGKSVYLDGKEVKSKTVLIDRAKVKVVGDVVEVISTSDTTDEPEEMNVALIVSLSVVGGVLVITSVIFIVFTRKKNKVIGKKSWKKVE